MSQKVRSVRAARSRWLVPTLVIAFLMIMLSVFPVAIAGVSTSSPPQAGSNREIGATPISSNGDAISSYNGWLTYHNNNARTGYDSSLPNIGSPSLIWKTEVDGSVYAEPLFYDGSVYVATENNTVFGMNVATGSVEWTNNLGPAASSTKPPLACPPNGPSIIPQVGVTGTPVIDPASGTIYAVAFINGSGYRIFGLNLNNGQIRWSAQIDPTGFNYLVQEQRGALALANGVVYVPFGGFDWICGDSNPVGYVFGFPTNDNGTVFMYKVPASPEGDIWTPEGVSVDSSGFVYVVTGDSDNSLFDYGCTVIKLTPDLKTVVGYFAPPNWQYLNTNDIDLGSTGATLLPGNLAFAIGKDGVGYLLNSSNLGGIGGQLYSENVCTFGYFGAWGSTAFAPLGNGIIYVPCGGGLLALSLHAGSRPSFSVLWNASGIAAGPPIIAAGAVWTFDIYNSELYALNPETGSLIFKLPSLLAPNALPHFTTPSAGGGLVLFAENDTVFGLNPVCNCTITTATHSSASTSSSSASSSLSNTMSSITSAQTSSTSATVSSSATQPPTSTTSIITPPPAPPPPNSSGVPTWEILLALIAAVIIVVAGTVLVLRQRRS